MRYICSLYDYVLYSHVANLIYLYQVMARKKEIECDAKREEVLKCIQKAVTVVPEEIETQPDISANTVTDIEKLSDDQISGTNEEHMIIDDPVEELQIDQDLVELSNDLNTSQAQSFNVGIDNDIRKFVQNSMGVHFDEELFKNLMDILRERDDSICPEYISTLLAKLQKHRAPCYQIIEDNIDLHIKPKHMTSTNQNKDIHWFNLNAVLHRVTENDLSDSKPSKFIKDMESVDFLPSQDDNLAFLTDLIPLAARVISDKIPAFEKFKSCVIRHIPHKYSDVMAKESDQVPIQQVF